MNISFETPDKVNGLLTITVEEGDYKSDVEKTLKDYRKRSNIPGFRPGQAPMGMIKRQFEPSIKMDTINTFVGKKIYDYIKENDIQILGEPLPSEKQEPIDLKKEAPYTFMFDIAVAPEINIELSASDKVAYYDVKVDDKMVDNQVDMFASRMGEYETAETYEGNDLLKGDMRELDADNNPKEGGITVEGGILMPSYIKVDDQKKLFDGAKLGDVITFNPKKAYPDNDTEIASLLKIERNAAKTLTSDFSFQVTEIKRFKKHAIDQALFDNVYGEGTVKDEQDFREKIAAGLAHQLTGESDYKLLLDLRAYCEKAVEELTFPDELLKRFMKAKNKDKDAEFVEKNYEDSIKELTWHLIKEELVKDNNVKINDSDVLDTARDAARAQFAQYGMSNVPAEYIDNFAKDLLKKEEQKDAIVNRSIERKLVSVLKSVVTLDKKEISVDEFNKMMEA